MFAELRAGSPRAQAYWAQQLAFGPVFFHAVVLAVRNGTIPMDDLERLRQVLPLALSMLGALPDGCGGDPPTLFLLARRQALALASGRRRHLARLAARLGLEMSGPPYDPVPGRFQRPYELIGRGGGSAAYNPSPWSCSPPTSTPTSMPWRPWWRRAAPSRGAAVLSGLARGVGAPDARQRLLRAARSSSARTSTRPRSRGSSSATSASATASASWRSGWTRIRRSRSGPTTTIRTRPADIPVRGGLVDPGAGSTSTLLVEEMRRRGLECGPTEATLLLLGIYEDTGLAHPRHHGAARLRGRRSGCWPAAATSPRCGAGRPGLWTRGTWRSSTA